MIAPVTGRRGLGITVALCVVGAGLAVLATGRAWVRLTATGAGVGTLTESLSGADVTAGTTALGLLALAGAFAVVSTRRLVRALVGVVLLAAGVAILLIVVGGLRAVDESSARGRFPVAVTGARLAVTAWPWVAAAAGMLVAVAGLLTAVAGRRWPALSSRYDAPPRRSTTGPPGTGPVAAQLPAPHRPTGGQPAPSRPTDDRALWDALDRGEDPT